MPLMRACTPATLLVLVMACGLGAAAAAPGIGSLVLVARPQLEHPLYGRTVLLAAPFGTDQHYGFIVNRPTRFKLGQMFPGHAPSQKVAEPVFLGGPFDVRMIFALVPQAQSPGPGSLQLMPGLHAVFNGRTVDRVIELKPAGARFVTGLVVWRPGELAGEIAAGFWYVLEPDASLATREPEGLWEQLVARAQRYGRFRDTSHSGRVRAAEAANHLHFQPGRPALPPPARPSMPACP